MKKTLIWLLVFTMLLLAGCQKAEPETSETAAITTEMTEQPTEAPTEPEAPEEPLSILEETDYILSGLSVGDGFCTVMEQPGGTRNVIVSYDLTEKTVLGKMEVGLDSGEAVAYPGGVAIFDWSTMSLARYTRELKEIDTIDCSDLSYGRPAGDGYFYGVGKDHTILRMKMESAQKEFFPMPEGFSADIITSVRGSTGLVEGNDAAGEYQRKMLNFETGEVTDCDMTEAPDYSGDAYKIYQGRNETWFRENGGEKLYVIPGENYTAMCSDETRVLLREKDQGLVLCDLENGLARKQPAQDTWSAVLCPQGIVYIQEGEKYSLRLWNCELTEPTELKIEQKTQADLEQENADLAEQIREQTGMELHYGENGAMFNEEEDTSYLGETVTDPLMIHLGLSQIASWASEYPDGMFQEMLDFGRDRIEIYLCGHITANGEGTVSDALAFASGQMSRWAVVVDLTGVENGAVFRSTMVHEFMHVMEDRILRCEQETGLPYGAYWEGFSGPEMYYYSYSDQDGNSYIDYDYTASSERPPEEIYFIDPYSRTFPIEDRARVLEYLYLGEESSFAKNLQEGVLGEKARYLCGLIRECFHSCQGAEELPWEKLVEDVSFDSYREVLPNYEVQAVG